MPRPPTAGQAVVHQFLAPVNDTFWVQRVVSPIAVSGTSVIVGCVAPTSDRWNFAAVEILPR